MLESVSLDQLRTFIAAVDEGSFSAAGRRLGRAQSMVSQTLANLEAQLGVQLFDRSARRPVLTAHGQALIGQARDVVGAMEALKSSARGLAGGREPELAIAVDVMFPIKALTCAVVDFRAAFPDTPLRIHVETLGAVVEPVLAGRCAFCIMGTLALAPPQMISRPLCGVPMTLVAAPNHPLAQVGGTIPLARASQEVQLVLTDRSTLSQGREFGVLSERTWRLADLGAKHAFLKAGLGWGGMPRWLVQEDIDAGVLVELEMEGFVRETAVLNMAAAWRAEAPPGLAGRWILDRLQSGHVSAS